MFIWDFDSKMSAELACTYAALILNDDGIDITGDKIATILKVYTTNDLLKFSKNLIFCS